MVNLFIKTLSIFVFASMLQLFFFSKSSPSFLIGKVVLQVSFVRGGPILIIYFFLVDDLTLNAGLVPS